MDVQETRVPSLGCPERVKRNIQSKWAGGDALLRGTRGFPMRFSLGNLFLREGFRNSRGGRSLGLPFLALILAVRSPSALGLCSWQPRQTRAGALATAGNLPGHFCAGGGLWQLERPAKRARQKGNSGLSAALETSAPPRPQHESQETKFWTPGPIGEGLWLFGSLARAPGSEVVGIWAGLPKCGLWQVRTRSSYGEGLR